jgi:cytochrome P450
MVRTAPFLDRCHARYGDSFTMRISPAGEPWVVTSNPQAVEQVFKGKPSVFLAGIANEPLRHFVGDSSVFLLDREEHLAKRRLILPFFHGDRIQSHGAEMTELTLEEVGRWPVGQPFNAWPRVQAVALEVIMRSVFGVRDAERLAKLRDAIARHRYRLVRELLLEDIRRRREAGDVAGDDVVSTLLRAARDERTPMPDEEVRDHLLTLLAAGHETTATAVAWAIERLTRHPEALERLRAELAAGEDQYLDAVVKETLRQRPVVPFVTRKLAEPVELAGWRLPAGANVMPCVYLVHRRADVYPEPHRFRPERFLDRSPGTYTWIPFGGGVRRCLGASFALFEAQLILAAIVSSAELRPLRPEPEAPLGPGPTLKPARGVEVVLESRRPVARG